MTWPCTWDEWSKFAQAVALLGGLLYFLARTLLGYFMINLSIEPTTTRQRSHDGLTDQVVLSLKLVKGDRESAVLERVVVSPVLLTSERSQTGVPPIVETFANPIASRKFKLSPGETAHFAYNMQVPVDAVCKVEVEVFGASGFLSRPKCYWKVSTISLP